MFQRRIMEDCCLMFLEVTFSRRSRKGRHESSWIQDRISRFVPMCRSMSEWLMRETRGRWPLFTRTQWVLFHSTSIFNSLGEGLECFGVPKFLRCYLAAHNGLLSGSSQIFAHVSLLNIHSLKSIESGTWGSAETSQIEVDVCDSWVRVSGGDTEFIKTRRS